MTPEQQKQITDQIEMAINTAFSRVTESREEVIKQAKTSVRHATSNLHEVARSIHTPLSELTRITQALELRTDQLHKETRALIVANELVRRLKEFEPFTKLVEEGKRASRANETVEDENLAAMAIQCDVERLGSLLHGLGANNDTTEQGDKA